MKNSRHKQPANSNCTYLGIMHPVLGVHIPIKSSAWCKNDCVQAMLVHLVMAPKQEEQTANQIRQREAKEWSSLPELRAGEVTQLVRLLAKPRDLHLLPRAQMLKEENHPCPVPASAHLCMAQTLTLTHRKGMGCGGEAHLYRPLRQDCSAVCYFFVLTLPVPPLQMHP